MLRGEGQAVALARLARAAGVRVCPLRWDAGQLGEPAVDELPRAACASAGPAARGVRRRKGDANGLNLLAQKTTLDSRFCPGHGALCSRTI